MSDIESEKEVAPSTDQTMPREEENVKLERGHFWEGNLSEKFTIKESTEKDGHFDVVLEEPFYSCQYNVAEQQNARRNNIYFGGWS